MFEIEVENTVIYTATLSDEDEIKKYILEHKNGLQFKSEQEKIIEAICRLGGYRFI